MTARLRIGGVPEHFNLPWKQAIADDAFRDIGIDVQFTEYPGGTGAMTAALAADELDAALLLTEGAVADILGGSDNRLVSVYVDSPLIWGIHVAAQGDIGHIDQIEGRSYAISRLGSGSHLIAIVDAAARGFATADMKFEIVGSLDGAREALANGNAEVFLWEKHMTQPLVDSGEFRRIGERAVPWPAFVVSARRDYLTGASDLLLTALNIIRGYAEALKVGENTAVLISETYGIKLKDTQAWLHHVEWSSDARRPDEAIERAVAALQAQGVVPADVAYGIDDIWASS